MGKPEKETQVLLVSDDPSEADEFAAGAHEKVARAIAALIDEGDGGKVIGLEGWWGSGKSTVVRMVSKYLTGPRLKGAVATRVIVFDAWAHQGDPLRRTFLESVIEDLTRTGWLLEAAAKELTRKLSGRTSSSRTRSTSGLTREAQIAAGTAVLLPFGAALFANDFQTHHRLALGIGAVLLAAPFLVVLGFAFAKVLGVLARGRRHESGWRRTLADLRPFSFFAKEQSIRTDTDEVVLGEPTSVEFERLFGEVLDKALTGQRQLVVVLDNLDRVDKTDAKTVIATMQTFTTASAYATRSWRKDLWTLIPYDPDGLERLWDAAAAASQGEQDGQYSLPTSTASAFLEKLFLVRFEAPPLVLSDWRGYLTRLLEQAMPDTPNDDFEAVLRIRALYPGVETTGLVGREPLTPRQLKQFVNQIVSIRRQRDDMPLAHIGYYVLCRRDRRDVAADLISGRLPHDRLAPLVGAEVQIDLAALHFGAPRDLAQQLLLGNALEGAFAANDSATVEQLKGRPGFVETLESLDFGARLAAGGVEFTRAVAVLQAAEAFDVSKVASWSKSVLLPLAERGSGWMLSGPETGKGLAVLLDELSTGDDSKLTELLRRIEPTAHEADADGQLQLHGVAALSDELIARGRSSDSIRIVVALPADRLVASISFFGAQTSDKRSWSALEVQAPAADVTQALLTASTSDGFRGVPEALDVLLTRPERIELPALAEGSVEWLRVEDPTSAEQLDTLLRILDIARGATSPDAALGPVADDGTLMHVFELARSNEWYAQAGEASMLHLLARPAFPDPGISRQSAAGVQRLRSILADPAADSEVSTQQNNWLERQGGEAFDLVMQLTSDGTASEAWTDYHLRELASRSALVVSSQQYLDNWALLRRALGTEGFNALTATLLGDAKSRTAIISGTSDPQLVATVLDGLGQSDEEHAAEIRSWASAVVAGASEPDWQAVLAEPSGGPLIALAVGLAGTSEAPSDPPGLDNALHTHFQALATGEPSWQTDGATLLKLASLLGAPARRSRASELCAWLEGRDGDVATELFTTYGAFLASERQFRIHPKLPNFVERLVARGEWDGVQWIVETAEAHKDTFQPNNRKAELEHLRNKVNEKLSEFQDEEPPAALRRLSELLGGKS